MWRYTGQSVIGSSHQKHEMPCQDAHRIVVLNNGALAVVIADGAGSAAHAEAASDLITQETIEQIRAWDAWPATEEEWTARVFELTACLRNQLDHKAEELDCDSRDLAATMLLVIVTDTVLAGMQIGDGAIVYGKQEEPQMNAEKRGEIRTDENRIHPCVSAKIRGRFTCEQTLHLLVQPEQGEYLNETVFLVSEQYEESLQTAYVPGDISKVALFSDGLQRLALDMRAQPPVPHRPFFDPLFEFLHSVDDPTDREQQLQAFLRSPKVASRTDDDLTLVLAMKE